MEIGLNFESLLAIIVSILIGLTVHEAMHAYVGYSLGDTTAQDDGRISLNPLRHIDPVATLLLPVATLLLFGVPILAAKPVPFNPARLKFDEFGAALVALGGPVSNLVLAIIGVVLAKLSGADGGLFEFLKIFIGINVSLFVFNMIPIPPLDGSRVLYAFAPEPVRRIMEQLEPLGFILVFGLVLLVPAFGQFIYNVNQSVLQLIT